MRELIIRTFPFSFRVTTNSQHVIDNLVSVYGKANLEFSLTDNDFAHYSVALIVQRRVGRLWKPQARFTCDGLEPFLPMDADKGFAMLEWGLNWVVAAHEVNHVIVHAGVLAKNDEAILLPAPPGSGKSTTSSAFMKRGWRLLSDELALINFNSLNVTPFVRPICLKNNAVNIVTQWLPNQPRSDIAPNTHKGDVMHLAPSEASWRSKAIDATLSAIVLPKYCADVYCEIQPLTQRQAFNQIFENCFNMGILGIEGFNTLSAIADKVNAYQINFNCADEVVDFIEERLGLVT